MAVFDGPNRRIILNAPTASVLNVLVQLDLYSQWKEWVTGQYTFDTEVDVNGTTERITHTDHSLYTGQRVVYFDDGGVEAIGLTDGSEYFVREIDRNTLELYDTKANAEAGPATTGRIDLTASGVGNGEDHRLVADNAKFPTAFRTVGGDPLTPGVEAGAYFFLQNQASNDWRIISTDEDQTINYNGNLVGEDSSLPLIVATPGRTVLHLGLQPVTQRVDEILTQSQVAAYNGVISIDVTSSNTGTEFPVGTRSRPVNNISDAVGLGLKLEIQSFEFRGLLTLNQNFPAWSFTGISAEKNDLLDLNGYNVDKTVFRSCGLQGSYTGVIEAVECDLNLLTGVNGNFRRCGISANMTLASGGDVVLTSCYSEIAGSGSPIIDCDGALSLSMRNFSGGIELANITNALFDASIDLDPGSITITNVNNTAGTVLIRGQGTMDIDKAAIGTTIIDRLLDANRQQDIHGQLEREIFVDTSLVSNGVGYQQDPYNNVTDAIDDAEANGVLGLVFLADATIDRQIKNFKVRGVGSPVIDANGQILDGCDFSDVELDGAIAAGSFVTAQGCILRNNLSGIVGKFLDCGFGGDLTLASGGQTTMVDCYSSIGGLGRPTLSINGALNVSVRSYRGGLTVQNMSVATSEVTVSMAQGKLTAAATCTDGTLSVRGTAQFTDSSLGTTIDDSGLLNTEELAIAIASLIGNADVTPDDLRVDILDKDLNVIRQLSVSADGRTRRIL